MCGASGLQVSVKVTPTAETVTRCPSHPSPIQGQERQWAQGKVLRTRVAQAGGICSLYLWGPENWVRKAQPISP